MTFLNAGSSALAAADPSSANIGLFDALVVGGVGYLVVFFGLVLLMVVVIIIGKMFSRKKAEKKAETVVAPVAPVAVETQPAAAPVAPGTAGELKLHDVPPKTAAMIMAIVADTMGKPLNELRFISIKEVK